MDQDTRAGAARLGAARHRAARALPGPPSLRAWPPAGEEPAGDRPGAPGGRRRLPLARCALAAVLVAQAAASARLLWANTAFQDEAEYLWLGHWELVHLISGAPVPSAVTWFSGAPVIYPVLAALAGSVGGLAAARMLSLAFMLAATGLLYLMTTRLFGRRAGVAAAAVFAALGPVQRLGAFATYDALAVFLLALASWLVVRGREARGERWLLAAAAALAAANAAKYASALWDPVVIGLAVLTAPGPGIRRAWRRGARLLLYTGVLEGALLWAGGHGYVQGLMFSTLSRHPGGASPVAVLRDSAVWIGAVVVLAAAGTAISFAGPVRIRLLCGLLTVAALLAPVHQAQIHTLTSLSKHVAFGAWFAAAAAGHALARGMRISPRIGWLLPSGAAAIIGIAGAFQATALFRSWPSSALMMAGMRPLVARAGCPCLASQSEVANYYLGARPYAITGPYFFSYPDPASGRAITGMRAYTQAIHAHYFRVVEVDSFESQREFDAVTSALATTPGYRLAAIIPEAGPGAGTVFAQLWWYRPGRPRGWP